LKGGLVWVDIDARPAIVRQMVAVRFLIEIDLEGFEFVGKVQIQS